MDGLEPRDEVRKPTVVFIGSKSDFIMEIWPGRGRGEDLEVLRIEVQSGNDVLTNCGSGGCSETDDWYRGES